MKKKNPGKMILIAIGGLLAVTMVTLGIMTAVNFSKLHNAEQKMKDSGYYNPVSVGDHSLNVTKTGNPDGEHKIVALSGWGDGTYALSWEYMTEPLEKDNEFIFIDRAGYGMSDDWDGEATVENIVNDYRTALKNAGIEGPYVLLAHSIGGLYTSYWVSTYPDEIEGAIIMDGSYLDDLNVGEDSLSDKALFTFIPYLDHIQNIFGLPRLNGTGYEDFLSKLSADKRDLSIEMLIDTSCSNFPMREFRGFCDRDLLDETRNSIKTNDVPKMYICSTTAYVNKDEIIEDGIDDPITNLMRKSEFNYLMDKNDLTEDDYYDLILAYNKLQRDELIIPYQEAMGNMSVEYLHGDHVIYLDRTEECRALINDFLAKLP